MVERSESSQIASQSASFSRVTKTASFSLRWKREGDEAERETPDTLREK
jgi:hypothetical protein